MKIAVIPTLNEEKTISIVLEKTEKQVDKVIVVDSSEDRTPEIIKENFPHVILMFERRRGKGLAVRKGIKKALKFNPDMVVLLDADYEKDPEDIKKIFNSLRNADMVIGKRSKMRSLTRNFLNLFTNFWIRILTEYKLTDIASGFVGIRANALKKMKLSSIGFEVETELILEAFRNSFVVNEVPVGTPRIAKSKLNLRHMIEINLFYDEWVLRYLKENDLDFIKKTFLYVACKIGLVSRYFLRISC